MTIQATNQIKVGDHVRLRNEDEYLGKVIDEKTVRYLTIQDKDGTIYNAVEDILVVAPRRTPDEAWEELSYLVRDQINAQTVWGALRLHEYDQKRIRHECYKLLGGAGIKVDEQVKARVRKAIARVAGELGVELA